MRYLILTMLTVCFFLLSRCTPKTQVDTQDAVAVINGYKISKADFINELEHIAGFRVSRHFSDDQKKVVLQDMIQTQLLLEKAEAEGFAFKNPNVRRLIVTEYLREYINKKFNPSDAEATALYKANQDKIDSVCVRHVLISTQSRSDAAAKAKVDEIYTKLQKGADFVDMAIFYSDDHATRESGGDVGCMTRHSEFVPEFLDAAFALNKVGTYSKPIKTQYGYHLIFLLSDRRGLEANRELIKNQLANSYRQQAFEALLVGAKEKADITAYFDRLPELNLTTIEMEGKSKKP